jgi:hypothetical protein
MLMQHLVSSLSISGLQSDDTRWCINAIHPLYDVLMQHLVSSLSVSGRPVHRLRENSVISISACASDGHLLRVTIPDAASIQFNLLMMYNKSSLCQDGHCVRFYLLSQFITGENNFFFQTYILNVSDIC